MEGLGPASYGDAFADVYDQWYRDLPETEQCAQVVAAAATGQPVLELGAGTGRLALAIAAQATPVVALDASAAMLDRLRDKDPARSTAVVVADMAAPPLRDRRFGVVLVAFNTLFNLPDGDAQLRCLAEARRVSTADGRLFVETIVFPETDRPVSGVDASVIEADQVVLTASRLDPRSRTVTGQHIEIRESGIRLRPWHLHYLMPGELDTIAAEAGWEVDARWESWDGAAFDAASRHQVARYRPR